MVPFGGFFSAYAGSSVVILFPEAVMIRYSKRGYCRIFMLINTIPLVLTYHGRYKWITTEPF
jgi:hypothetical protein